MLDNQMCLTQRAHGRAFGKWGFPTELKHCCGEQIKMHFQPKLTL